MRLNQELWNYWEEDFYILPFLHRSPLDAANGIRGTELFLEMYTGPEKVKQLLNWCVDWQLRTEKFLSSNITRPQGWGVGVWGTWLPDHAVFVNGDPVGLISREMQQEFEGPFTERLFTATGGGFFHNHTVGLFQVDLVAKTKGLLVQEFIRDPGYPNVSECLLNNPLMRDTILQASLRAPIMIERITPEKLDSLLPIVKKGRFILSVDCKEGDTTTSADVIDNIRKVSNIT